MRPRVMVLGPTGMLGHMVAKVLVKDPRYKVSARTDRADKLAQAFDDERPDQVINCIGLVKQRPDGDNLMKATLLNAVLPYRLLALCKDYNAKLIHISSDCVFSGMRGNYSERDTPDARDVYGFTKAAGEIADKDAVTLRTSIIGPEKASARGLMQWFLGVQREVTGYSHHIFSGLTTLELAKVIRDFVLPRKDTGVWHVGSDPISKYELLMLINGIYAAGKTIKWSDGEKVDRSLNSTAFRKATGYAPPSWYQMLREMRHYV